MSFISKEEIRKMVKRGNPNIHSHALICVDRFDYSYFPKYVDKGEDVKKVISSITSHSMTSIEEVYSYDLNLEFQFSEFRAYHLDPVEEALKFATRMHEGQYRTSGKPILIIQLE